MKLPIQRIPNTTPPQFIYYQTINLPQGGVQSIQHTGCVPPAMEASLCGLIRIAQQLAKENTTLKKNKES